MNPAFSVSTIKVVQDIRWDVAAKLRDQLSDLIEAGPVDGRCFATDAAADDYRAWRPEGQTVVDPQRWMTNVTKDIIGLAAFGHDFSSLDLSSSSSSAHGRPIAGRASVGPTARSFFVEHSIDSLVNFAPWLLHVFSRSSWTKGRDARARAKLAARKLLDDRRVEGVDGGRDLLSVLLRSMEDDAKLQMTGSEVLADLTTILVVGQGTFATAIVWALELLTEHPQVQIKLREECTTASARANGAGHAGLTDAPTQMPCLTSFTKEVLRVASPVSWALRQALLDDLIPLSTPIESATGDKIKEVHVKKGQAILISLQACNFNRDVFGADADDFRPERWLDGHVGGEVSGPGMYSHLMSFLVGPRHCIGQRLALAEFKAIITTLVLTSEFDKRDPETQIRATSGGNLTKPIVVGEESLGHGAPMRVRMASIN